MRITRETKAISPFIMILLILCSMIVGALVSYMWIMANYYNMPENTTLLIVENVNFPVTNFTYFGLTLLNPSNSASDWINVTAFLFRVESRDEAYLVQNTEPPVPFISHRGTRQDFKCIANWSNFTGEVVRIEPLEVNASVRSEPHFLPNVKLSVTPNFDPTLGADSFNVTLENPAESVANLTITEIDVFSEALNVTPAFPRFLPVNQTESYKCYRNWENLKGQNATIKVKTVEGYEASYTTDQLPGASLRISDVSFDHMDTSYFNLTINSSEDSTVSPIVNRLELTLQNGTTIPVRVRFPPLNTFFSSIRPNQSLTFVCDWSWIQHRSENTTFSVYTNEKFAVNNKTVQTPPDLVWNATAVRFDLDDLLHFSVNVTNTSCSLSDINVTSILLGNATVMMDPPSAVITNGTRTTFSCTYDWTNLRGSNATVTVLIGEGGNISKTLTLPSMELKVVGDSFIFGDFHNSDLNTTIPYVNITISNSLSSLRNVTITKVIIDAGNVTYEVDNTLTTPKLAPSGYNLTIGQEVTIVYITDYLKYLSSNQVKVTVFTSEGLQVSKTWLASPP